jgi:peptide/nickel transport system substrate-binding protein
MQHEPYSRRDFLQQAVLATGGTLLLASCTYGGNSSGSSPAGGGPATGVGELPPLEGGVVLTDPAKLPTKLSESPDFARLVAAGKLPPVADRIGQDPLVIQPLHEIGKYGGELRRGYTGVGDFQNANRFCAGPDSLLYWDYKQENVVPNIARGYELSDNGKLLTLHLRRGMKWSDGQPFTADDIIFWREDVNLNPDLGNGAAALRVQGQNVKVVKVDDSTVQFVSPLPYFLLPQLMATWSDVSGLTQAGPTGGGCYAPKHYLMKFHPKYTAKAQIDRMVAASGLKDWTTFFLQKCDWALNPELPLVTPWIVTRPINKSPWSFEANPYSVWVDSQGNQLPYIGKVTMRETGSQEVLNLRAVAGEYDFQDRGLPLSSLPVLLKNQQRSNYKIYRAPGTRMDFMLRINLAYAKDQVLGDLLRNVDFRRALSLGIDRNQHNQTYFLGTCIPTATMVADDNPYYPGTEWRTKWATFDQGQANSLLDKIGLTARDSAGYRMRPDGKGRIRLIYQTNKGLADYGAMGELVKKQWKDIGIDLTVEVTQANRIVELILANEIMIQAIGGGTDDPLLKIDSILPTTNNQGAIGIPYSKWFASGGKKGVEPPESVRLLKDAMALYQRGLISAEAERISLGKQILMLHADQVWSIGVLGFGLAVYGIYYAKNNLGNVPARVINSEFVKSPTNALPMTFFYK